jgi:HD-like signal output (HDOD) protein
VISDFAKRLERIIDFLSPMPIVMAELLKALGDEDVEMNDLAKIIKHNL